MFVRHKLIVTTWLIIICISHFFFLCFKNRKIIEKKKKLLNHDGSVRFKHLHDDCQWILSQNLSSIFDICGYILLLNDDRQLYRYQISMEGGGKNCKYGYRGCVQGCILAGNKICPISPLSYSDNDVVFFYWNGKALKARKIIIRWRCFPSGFELASWSLIKSQANVIKSFIFEYAFKEL